MMKIGLIVAILCAYMLIASAGSSSVSLRWIHIPKCGQGFAITLIAWGCEPTLAESAIRYLVKSKRPSRIAQMVKEYPLVETCSHAGRTVIPPVASHYPVNRSTDLGNVAVMFREPSERLRSHQGNEPCPPYHFTLCRSSKTCSHQHLVT